MSFSVNSLLSFELIDKKVPLGRNAVPFQTRRFFEAISIPSRKNKGQIIPNHIKPNKIIFENLGVGMVRNI